MSYVAVNLKESIDVHSLRPLNDQVLVKVFTRTMSAGGIHLSTTGGHGATECLIGEVISVGKEIPNSKHAKGYPIELKPGDHILSMKYMGDVIETQDGEYRFVRAQGIWAKVKLKDLKTFEIEDIWPRFQCLVAEPVDDEKTQGGIYLAAGHDKEQPYRKARIVKMGPGVWNSETYGRIPQDIREGDEVLMLRYSGGEITVNGKLLRIMDYSDIKVELERA